MSITQSLLLGTVQGITEFLPISSSGHLVLLQHYMEIRESAILFDVLVHIGTLAAVMVFFRKDIFYIAVSLTNITSKDKKFLPYHHIILAVILGTIPTAFLGLALNRIKDFLFQGATLPAAMLLFTGSFLWLADRFPINPEGKQKIGILDALLIGMMQGIAIIPGISRSGVTISSGLMRGLDRELSFRYSFFLFIPAAVGALVLEGREAAGRTAALTLPFLAGTLTAFITGIAALAILKKTLREKRLAIFSWYCWALGGGLLFFKIFNLIR